MLTQHGAAVRGRDTALGHRAARPLLRPRSAPTLPAPAGPQARGCPHAEGTEAGPGSLLLRAVGVRLLEALVMEQILGWDVGYTWKTVENEGAIRLWGTLS